MRINQHYTPYFCGTPAAFAEFIAEEPLRAQPLYLPDEPGSLNQNKPFGSDLVTGQGPRHLGDATPANNSKRKRGVIGQRLREAGDLEAANYIAQLEGRERAANERAEAARVSLVLHTKELLRTLKRWGMVSPKH